MNKILEPVMSKTEPSSRSSPLGATLADGGVNFSLFSRTATGVELLFFDRVDDATPSRVVQIDLVTNRTYHYWHIFVPEVRPGQIYGYRVEGRSDPRVDYGSTPPRSCSTRTAGPWSFRRTTTARLPGGQAIRPAPR
jgi:pullulanase/glycogen debranching enzyme